ncbi:unnamed protein product [Ilex paraguariensis]|uniref:Uncharacterized protein n=1 Tax=Ilex paraguariensis TaxID=185542 RepID=A0ABC8U2R5_9AQUA
MHPTAIKANIVCRSGIIELPEARVNAKVNLDGTKELSSNASLGSHSRDKGITGQTQVQTGEVAIGEIPIANKSRSSGETSKELVDVNVLPKDKQSPEKTQPNLPEAQQKHPGPRAPWNQVDTQVTEIIVNQVASSQLDIGRITPRNKFPNMSLEGGEIIVDLAAEAHPSNSICNDVTKEKEKTNGNKHPLGNKKKKVKKKAHEMGKSKVTEHLILRTVLLPQ